MDFSFQEKSAWGMLLGIVVVSYFYFPAAFEIAERVPQGVPLILMSVVGVVALIIIEALYHALISAPPGEHRKDERDTLLDLKSERIASYALGAGLFSLIGHVIVTHSIGGHEPIGALSVAVWVLFLITVSEVVKLMVQIWYYRTGS